jgi:hypothetical protein
VALCNLGKAGHISASKSQPHAIVAPHRFWTAGQHFSHYEACQDRITTSHVPQGCNRCTARIFFLVERGADISRSLWLLYDQGGLFRPVCTPKNGRCSKQSLLSTCQRRRTVAMTGAGRGGDEGTPSNQTIFLSTTMSVDGHSGRSHHAKTLCTLHPHTIAKVSPQKQRMQRANKMDPPRPVQLSAGHFRYENQGPDRQNAAKNHRFTPAKSYGNPVPKTCTEIPPPPAAPRYEESLFLAIKSVWNRARSFLRRFGCMVRCRVRHSRLPLPWGIPSSKTAVSSPRSPTLRQRDRARQRLKI